jgi:arabinose-5-phosphate isomerase
LTLKIDLVNSTEKIIQIAKETISIEQKAIANLENLVDNEFAEAVNHIYNSNGRVIVSGIGKSANIATKIVATMNSTGTPAIFMHAADAIHGDLGTVQKNDTVICISKSGNTPEIKVLVPLIKKGGNKLIALTSNRNSFLGTEADFILHAYAEKEACPNNLAPTTSTTAQLVMGDALAVSLLKLKDFKSSDFAKYHPGGALGKRLYLRVSDLISKNEKPAVNANASIKDVIIEISNKRLGVTAVIDDHNKIIGIITDGDLRRMLAETDDINSLKASDIMSASPKTLPSTAMAIEAKELLEENNISQLLIEDENQFSGVVHIHDLVKEGIL